LARACFSASSYCFTFSARGRLRRLGGLLRAQRSRVALSHYLQKGLEEYGSQDEIKNKDDQGYRHSPKKQFPYLAN